MLPLIEDMKKDETPPYRPNDEVLAAVGRDGGNYLVGKTPTCGPYPVHTPQATDGGFEFTSAQIKEMVGDSKFLFSIYDTEWLEAVKGIPQDDMSGEKCVVCLPTRRERKLRMWVNTPISDESGYPLTFTPEEAKKVAQYLFQKDGETLPSVLDLTPLLGK